MFSILVPGGAKKKKLSREIEPDTSDRGTPTQREKDQNPLEN